MEMQFGNDAVGIFPVQPQSDQLNRYIELKVLGG